MEKFKKNIEKKSIKEIPFAPNDSSGEFQALKNQWKNFDYPLMFNRENSNMTRQELKDRAQEEMVRIKRLIDDMKMAGYTDKKFSMLQYRAQLRALYEMIN